MASVQDDPVILAVDGTFDIPAVWRLRDAIASTPRAAAVIVDFSHTRDVYEFALAILLGTTEMRRPITLRGLGQHHYHGLLEYLSVSPEAVA
jgi:hypothetical protein